MSSFTTETGWDAAAGTGTADDEEIERRRDEEAGVEFAADDADGGGKAAEVGGTGRVHLISQGGGGGTWAAGTLMRCGGE
jgi:hypothetical protein